MPGSRAPPRELVKVFTSSGYRHVKDFTKQPTPGVAEGRKRGRSLSRRGGPTRPRRGRVTRRNPRPDDLAREPLEPVAREHRAVLLVPGGHHARAAPDALPATRSAAPVDPHARPAPTQSRPRSITTETRGSRTHVLPRGVAPTRRRRRSRPRATRTIGARRAGPPLGSTVARSTRRHVAERLAQELEVAGHPASTRSAKREQRSACVDVELRGFERRPGPLDQRVDPLPASSVTSPSRSSSRSWNAMPSGAP